MILVDFQFQQSELEAGLVSLQLCCWFQPQETSLAMVRSSNRTRSAETSETSKKSRHQQSAETFRHEEAALSCEACEVRLLW